MTDADLVLLERHGHTAVLTLNRPAARNAISQGVTRAMAAHLDVLAADDDVWVVVITGAGDQAFCAGADLKSRAEAPPTVPELGGFAAITARVFPKPLIAAVNGFALGGGMEICLACDLVVAEEHASFGLPEVRRGIVAGAGGMERLPRRIPPAIAMEMILTGRPIDAATALRFGLVNRVVAKGAAVAAALELAAVIGECAPLAVRYSKAVARASLAHGEADAMGDLAALRERALSSDDAKEGPRAFAEKRPPVWTGR